MKIIISVFLFFALISCKQQTNDMVKLQDRIKVLEEQVANSYKPGFGEMMSSVQSHHAKLWFAGINRNWKLAEFEVHELVEVLDNIKKHQKDRDESQLIDMMNPALDSVSLAIKNKEMESFKSNYSLLTTTCNNCHVDTKFEYNIVKIPEIQQFSNQSFKINP